MVKHGLTRLARACFGPSVVTMAFVGCESSKEAGHMRKLIVLSFITLDGIMQAPGGPEEDPSGEFKYGGWSVGYFDESLGNIMAEQMGHPFDLLPAERPLTSSPRTGRA